MKASTARALRTEAMKMRKMKEHVARWEHQQSCPACRAGVSHGDLRSMLNGLNTEDLPHGTVISLKKPTIN